MKRNPILVGAGLEVVYFTLPAVLPAVPAWVAQIAFWSGFALIAWGFLGGYQWKLRDLWYDFKCWGIAVSLDRPIGLSGSVNDLRYIHFRIKVKNNSSKWIEIKDFFADNSVTGERLPGYYNPMKPYCPEQGRMIPVNKVRGLPPKSEGYLAILFDANFHGCGITSDDFPKVEDCLRAWPGFVLVVQLGNRTIRKLVSEREHTKLVNKALDGVRSRNRVKPGLTK